jgi:hypothetical protein
MKIHPRIFILNLILCLIFFLGFTISLPLIAADPKAATQPIDVSKKNVSTQESIIELNGKTFRKIQYEKDTYYLEMVDVSGANEAYRLMCSRGHDDKLPAQVKAGVKLTKRSHFIVEGLKQYCAETQEGRREVALDSRIVGGLQFSLEKDLANKETFLKNKKLIITPIDGLVFKADW